VRSGPFVPRFLAGPEDGRLDFYESTERLDEITFEEDIIFSDSRGVIWIAPSGLICDGASIPRPLWTFVGHPLQARHVASAGTHDQSYKTGFRLTIDPEVLALVIIGEMTPAEICSLPRVEQIVDRDEVDFFALYEPLRATKGNTFAHARAIYHGVRFGGWYAWNRHVRRRARDRVIPSRVQRSLA
jgi:hypothetical protein